MKVIVDIDDVCLRWLDGFNSFLDKHNVTRKTPYPQSWEFKDWIQSDIPMREWVVRFNWSKDFDELEPVAGAYDTLCGMVARGYEVIAVTSCGKFAKQKRMDQLQRHFPNIFSRAFILNVGSCKEKIIKSIRAEDQKDLIWFIDDNAAFIHKATDYEAYCFFMLGPHNKNDLQQKVSWVSDDAPTTLHVNSWEEIHQHILRNEIPLLAGSRLHLE